MVVVPVVSEADGAVDQFGEGLVEDGVCDAVVVEVDLGEEGLVEGAFVVVAAVAVELVAALEQGEGEFEPFFDEAGVELGE